MQNSEYGLAYIGLVGCMFIYKVHRYLGTYFMKSDICDVDKYLIQQLNADMEIAKTFAKR